MQKTCEITKEKIEEDDALTFSNYTSRTNKLRTSENTSTNKHYIKQFCKRTKK